MLQLGAFYTVSKDNTHFYAPFYHGKNKNEVTQKNKSLFSLSV